MEVNTNNKKSKASRPKSQCFTYYKEGVINYLIFKPLRDKI